MEKFCMSQSIRFHKNNADIHSVENWFKYAPPKEGKKHWQDGRSAKELAKRWLLQKGDPQVPAELIDLLNSNPDLNGTIISEGIPEHKVKLDNFRGETRNTDLVLIGEKGDRKVSISIEAKADETFDQMIYKKINAVKNKRSKIPQRIDLLCRSLFGQTIKEFSDLGGLRYQLLTGAAGALIEAGLTNADVAVFVVHMFLSSAVDRIKIEENSRDFTKFVQMLSNWSELIAKDGVLIGPILVNGGDFVPSNIPLYIGKICTDLKPC
jgi:hypothetical protein